MTILVGPAGLGSPAITGLDKIKKAGLSCASIAFTHSIYMNNKMAKEVGAHAKKLGIKLSVHAPYYINLASEKKSIINASKKRILQAAERAHHLGAKYVVFHAGYYGKRDKDEVFEMVEYAINQMQEVIAENDWKVMLAPESTGKLSQFGEINELYELHKKTKCAVCVDFSHEKAKHQGKIDYKKICDIMKKFKFRPLLAHMSGIEWGPKGERRHVVTQISYIKEVLYWLKKYKFDIQLINESPETLKDAVKTSKLLK